MEFRGEPCTLARPEDVSSLFDGKGGLLHKDITEARKAVARDLRNQTLGEKLDIPAAIVLEFRGDNVSTQKGRHQSHRLTLCQPSVHPKQLQLGVFSETVAALALNRGDA